VTTWPTGDDDGWHRLDPRYPVMARQLAWIRLVLWGSASGLLAFGVWWLTPQHATASTILATIWALPLALLAILWFRIPVLRYRHSSWRLDGDSLELRRGAWWFSETRVPRSRIQHTDVGQGPIERRHALGHLIVHTAGTHHGRIVLRGIAYDDALTIRDRLLQGDVAAPV
jgi:hypothetical protein